VELLKQVALQHLGVECEGVELMQVLLATCGEQITPWDSDVIDLYKHFSTMGNGDFNRWDCGALAFFGDDKPDHMGMLLNETRMIESTGISRVRLIKSRADLIAVIRPRYNKIGLF
jgi:hypothetical protein